MKFIYIDLYNRMQEMFQYFDENEVDDILERGCISAQKNSQKRLLNLFIFKI